VVEFLQLLPCVYLYLLNLPMKVVARKLAYKTCMPGCGGGRLTRKLVETPSRPLFVVVFPILEALVSCAFFSLTMILTLVLAEFGAEASSWGGLRWDLVVCGLVVVEFALVAAILSQEATVLVVQ
jgi:hypothetical protein